MSDPSQEQPAPLSFFNTGPVYWLLQRSSFVRTRRLDTPIRSVGYAILTLGPLLAFAAAQGVLYGPRVELPLLSDWTVWVRFAFAVPVLIIAERFVDRVLSVGIFAFRTSGLLDGQARTDFEGAFAKLTRAGSSILSDLILLAGAFAVAWVSSRALLGLPVSSWRTLTPGVESSATLAGRWLDLVCMPLLNFLILRWLWRMALWFLFLARIARSDLTLIPTHPDGAAGLGFLGEVHTSFSGFLIPIAAIAAARGVQFVALGGVAFESVRATLIAFAVIAIALALGPLLVFTPKLSGAKRRGLIEYSLLASDYTRRFDRKWVRTHPGDDLLGTADIQSLADLANSFAVVERMRLVPMGLRHVVAVALAAVLPMLPLVALVVPVEKLLSQLMSLLMR